MAENTLFSLPNFQNKNRLTVSSYNGGLSFSIWPIGNGGGAGRPLFVITITDLGGPEFIAHEFTKIAKSSPGTVATINYAAPRSRESRDLELKLSIKVEQDQKGMFRVTLTDVKTNTQYPFDITMPKNRLTSGSEDLTDHQRSAFAFKSVVYKLEHYFDKNEYGKMGGSAAGGAGAGGTGGFKPSGGYKPAGGYQQPKQQAAPNSGSGDLFR